MRGCFFVCGLSGLSGDIFSIAGRGSYATMRCDAIADSVSYTFTDERGTTTTVAINEASMDIGSAPADGHFIVYATNANGVNTLSAAANF